MQTNLADWIKDTPQGQEAESILRMCVHCGFCTATCPTYQLLGDELDGPRGRIYLIKQMLEGNAVTAKTQLHLDRCLTCRSCETTCPSGVKYGRLVDIGRAIVDEKVGRPLGQRIKRGMLHWGLTSGPPFAFAVGIGRLLRGLLPARLKRSLQPRVAPGLWPQLRHPRKMLVLKGCVQPALLPRIDAAAARVLDRLAIDLVSVPESGCCGAVSHHMDMHDAAVTAMKRNIDAWWPHIEQGAEAIVVTASGCGVMVKDYGHLLRLDPRYAARAARVSELAKDVSEVIAAEWERITRLLLASEPVPVGTVRMAFHSPCTLQHGLKLKGGVERILRDLGYTLAPVADAHLCCGSAGTYSILQPELSQRLKADKLAALQAGGPAVIASANVGCITHLQSGTDLPVRHWIELLDDRLAAAQ
ncbi:MAG: glycolate oxidase subunit GlcF [Betaproteobacteria bacterium]|nr:glycolate oxidase subunit GlcF [Betaproteobacteria bacterium]